jgi:hypothetical protein
MRSVLAFAMIVALAGSASAQAVSPPGVTPAVAPDPPGDPMSSLTSRPPLRREPLSEAAALQLSLYGTALSWAAVATSLALDHNNSAGGPLFVLGGIGTLLAPSFGHIYANSFLTRGLGLRVLGLGVLIGLVTVEAKSECEESCNNRGVVGIALGALGLYAWGTVDDIATAPRAVRRYNERLRNVTLVPMVRRNTAGVVLSAQF